MAYRIHYKKGELIALSHGEYSDYRFNGLYRCLANLDLEKLAKEYYAQAPHRWGEERTAETEPWEIAADDAGFGAWLILNRHVEEVAYTEIHCGGYGEFKIQFRERPATTIN